MATAYRDVLDLDRTGASRSYAALDRLIQIGKVLRERRDDDSARLLLGGHRAHLDEHFRQVGIARAERIRRDRDIDELCGSLPARGRCRLLTVVRSQGLHLRAAGEGGGDKKADEGFHSNLQR